MKKASKQLQREWAKKLKDSGFKDIEAQYGTEHYLKQYDSHYFHNRFDVTRFEANETYFRDALHKMWTFKFSTKYDKTIWWLHANGRSNPQIAAVVGKSKDKVRKDLAKLKREMLGLN